MLLAIALLAGQAQSGPGVATPLQPATSPASWVSFMDYPPEALRKGHQGTVSFEMEIGVDGVPISCTVLESSGFEELDRKTCSVLQQRARFTPARDASGKAIAATFSSRFNWRSSNGKSLPAIDEYRRVEIELTAAGEVARCDISDNNLPPGAVASCEGVREELLPALLPGLGGEGRRRVLVMETATVVRQPMPALRYSEPGHVQRSYFRRRVSFAADGSVASCMAELQVGGGEAPFLPQRCDGPDNAPPLGADGKPEAATITTLTAISRVDL